MKLISLQVLYGERSLRGESATGLLPAGPDAGLHHSLHPHHLGLHHHTPHPVQAVLQGITIQIFIKPGCVKAACRITASFQLLVFLSGGHKSLNNISLV